MTFSLILTTVGRIHDLRRFFHSLEEQTHKDFEVLVIDHKPNEVVPKVLAEFDSKLNITYLGSAEGHSKALNLGLRSCTGDVIACPDDDCWYPADLLERIDRMFHEHGHWSGITGRVVTGDGEPSNGRWDRQSGFVTRSNAWKRAITISLFFRRASLDNVKFDETLGVGAGTPWGAGEETDFLLEILKVHPAFYYDPAIKVNHPPIASGEFGPAVCSKARAYARGVGRVLRKQGYPKTAISYHVARPLFGAALSFLTLRTDKARYHWSIAAGRFNGYFGRLSHLTQPPALQGAEMLEPVSKDQIGL